jgi:hypothetical protein
MKTMQGEGRGRNEGCPIIYMDETYIHFSQTKEHAWDDGTNAGLQQRWE